MKVSEVREKYIEFFKKAPRNHKEIPAATLVPDNDPSTLFVSSGMQPLVPYLMGEIHPEGTRLVDSQPSIRLQDIEEVGDNRHTTFFEMLGNWSLGDYFKKEQLAWFLEFLTKELGLDKDKLWVSVFEGNNEVPKDEESFEIWKSLGIPEERIGFYNAKKNWWSRSGTPDEMPVNEIGGPDSEVFYDFGEELKLHENSPFKNEKCHMNCDCGRFLEIGNSVFMQYIKQEDGTLSELPNKNVDFGGGLERLAAATINSPDVFKIDVFKAMLSEIEIQVGKKYSDDPRSFRIILDHIRAATFLAGSGVIPSNKQQGYVMRRLIRRAIVKARKLKDGVIEPSMFIGLVKEVINTYKDVYFRNSIIDDLLGAIHDEVTRFYRTLDRGMHEVEKIKEIDAKKAFDLYQTFGFPVEITEEIFSERGQKINKEEFKKEFDNHKEKSRTAASGMFKGGLADKSEETVKLHTATHLLHWALRKTLGDQVIQHGSNITHERLRFDFNHEAKLTDKQIEKIENLINEKVKESLPVNFEVMDKAKAEKTGAIHAFGEKYGDKVKIYYIGKDLETAVSKEFCGGPHVTNTSEIGRVTITKQQKIGAGRLRVYAEVK